MHRKTWNRLAVHIAAFAFMALTGDLSAQNGKIGASAESRASAHDTAVWRFAVSGDSRNCGGVVMPAIAAGAVKDGAEFYWHLGDFRALYQVDEDIAQAGGPKDLKTYQQMAWDDFIERQLVPFGRMPVYLGRGNHEEAGVKTRTDYVCKFADWLDEPEIRAQRLKDDPADHTLRTYYHWIERGVDFVNMDNAGEDQFEPEQMKWFERVLERDASDSSVTTVVVGMHRALPDSIAAGHSMNDTPAGTTSGRRAYADLVDFRRKTGKKVYVLASHAHFYMTDVYNTACRQPHPDTILPGWIIGSAGAVRYRLPADHGGAKEAATDVYGYLLGSVSRDGTIVFEFKQINPADIPSTTRQHNPEALIDGCFKSNSANFIPDGPPQPPHCPK
jgi:hypothetical protein